MAKTKEDKNGFGESFFLRENKVHYENNCEK